MRAAPLCVCASVGIICAVTLIRVCVFVFRLLCAVVGAHRTRALCQFAIDRPMMHHNATGWCCVVLQSSTDRCCCWVITFRMRFFFIFCIFRDALEIIAGPPEFTGALCGVWRTCLHKSLDVALHDRNTILLSAVKCNARGIFSVFF